MCHSMHDFHALLPGLLPRHCMHRSCPSASACLRAERTCAPGATSRHACVHAHRSRDHATRHQRSKALESGYPFSAPTCFHVRRLQRETREIAQCASVTVAYIYSYRPRVNISFHPGPNVKSSVQSVLFQPEPWSPCPHWSSASAVCHAMHGMARGQCWTMISGPATSSN